MITSKQIFTLEQVRDELRVFVDYPDDLAPPLYVQPSASAKATDVLYTHEEVSEAMQLLRQYRSAIPKECIDQMESVLRNAADGEAG